MNDRPSRGYGTTAPVLPKLKPAASSASKKPPCSDFSSSCKAFRHPASVSLTHVSIAVSMRLASHLRLSTSVCGTTTSSSASIVTPNGVMMSLPLSASPKILLSHELTARPTRCFVFLISTALSFRSASKSLHEMPGVRIAASGDRPLKIGWPLPDPAPLVSIIIPTRDRANLLGPCLEGLFRRTDYPALEVIVVDNGSTEPSLHELLARWSADPRLRVLLNGGPFNFALLNNQAAAKAQGEILVLLNNDTEVLHPEWLGEMVSLAVRPEIGAVGAKLFFPSGRIQHAGVILGPRGVAGHDYLFAKGMEEGQQDDLLLVRQVSAVTGACLAVSREKYLAVGGMDEENFRVAYNDVDFCLKLGAAGLRNVFTPHARLRHHEGASRGSDFSGERFALWEAERDAMRKKWGGALDDDPFFSPLLSFSKPARTPAEPPRTYQNKEWLPP